MSKTKEVNLKWTFDDIKTQAEQRGILLSENEIGDVLDEIKNRHDPTIGITWDVINIYIDGIIHDRKKEPVPEWYEAGIVFKEDKAGKGMTSTKSVLRETSVKNCLKELRSGSDILYDLYLDPDVIKVFIDSWYTDENNTPKPLETIMEIVFNKKRDNDIIIDISGGVSTVFKNPDNINVIIRNYDEICKNHKLAEEVCGFCSNTVHIAPNQISECPVCGNKIKPCSTCNPPHQCSDCPYD